MMFRSLVILLAAGGLVGLAPSRASAEESSLFAAFRLSCVDMVGDVAATRAAAIALGFTAVPAPTEGLKDAESFISDQGDKRRFISIKRTIEPAQGPVPESEEIICGLGQNYADASFAEEAARWAGVPQDTAGSRDGTKAYAFTITTDGGRRSLAQASDAQAAEAVKASGIWLLLVNDTDETPTLVLVFARATAGS